MLQRKIRYGTHLADMLAVKGIELSRYQISRLVNGQFNSINLDSLEALCEILQCEPNDLIVFGPDKDRTVGIRRGGVTFHHGTMGREPQGSLNVRPISARIAGLDDEV